jgi:hypothetical protein
MLVNSNTKAKKIQPGWLVLGFLAISLIMLLSNYGGFWLSLTSQAWSER